MSNKCPNVNSPEWKSLLAELNNSTVSAMNVYMENGYEIPDVNDPIVQEKKKININYGPDVEVVMDEDGNETNNYKKVNGNTLYNRISIFINNFANKKLDRTKSFAERKADRVWGSFSPEEKIRTDLNEDQTKEEYIESLQKNMDMSTDKGKVIHFAMEKKVLPHRAEEFQAKIDEILARNMDEKGNLPFNWKWIERENVIETIFDNVGINYFKELKGVDSMLRDELNSEVTIASDAMGMAGTIDMLVKHSDETFTIVDWKTGRSMNKVFKGMDDVLMKYGNQASLSINDSIRNRAKLQIAMYAIMMRAQNPHITFRALNLGWIPSEYESLQKDSDMSVNVHAFIPMIEQFLSDPVMLEEAGLPASIRDTLLKQDPDIFNPTVYSNGVTQDFADEMRTSNRTPQEDMNAKIDELKMITSKSLDYTKLLPKERERAEQLVSEIQQIGADKNVIANKANYEDMSTIAMWIGNYSEASHPMVQAWKQFKDEQFVKAKKKAEYKKNKFQALQRPVQAEYEKRMNILKTPIGKAINYDDLYGFMYVDQSISDETNQTKERLLTNTEEDPELKAKYNALSSSQKALLNYVNEEFSSYFNGAGAYLNETAVIIGGKSFSHTQLFNKNKKPQDKRIWSKGFFFKLPPTAEDIILRNGKGNELRGRFSKKTLGMLLHRYGTFFRENNYEGWDHDAQALPIKFLGNEYIDSSRAYTKNMEMIFFNAVEELEYKKYMDPVYAMGVALRYKLASETTSPDSTEPAYANLSKFMDVKLQQDIQRKLVSRNGRERGIRMKMYTGNGWESQKVSTDAIVRSLTKWASMNTMWLKPFQGTGNGVHAALLTHRDGLKGSISQLNLLGIKGESIDFTYSDIVKAEGLYMSEYLSKAMQGDFRSSKIYLLAKEFNYFGNNFDYGEMEKTLLSLRNRYMNEGVMYLFHSLPEEFVSMTTMTAQLLHMKNEATGKSIYDSYDVVEMLDDNGKKTGQNVLEWNGGIRGHVTKSSGNTQWTETLRGLDSKEQARIRKVHERLQGGYRKDEATLIEAYAIGKMFVHLKKYFPRLILNAMHSKRNETDLGHYKKLMDPKTGEPILIREDGTEMPMYEWIQRVTEGRFMTIAGISLNLLTLGSANRDYRWENLSDEQKQNVIEGVLTLTMLMATYGVYLHFFEDDKDDSTMKKWWKMYLVDNLSQQYNVVDMARSMKTIMSPVAFGKASDFVMHGANMLVAGANYGLGNDDAAFTKAGDLKGWNSFVKTVPLLSSYKDLMSKIENTTDPNNSFLYNMKLNKLR